jgi:hypothetical protein
VTTRLPFCSPDCRDRQGQIEDPETGLPVGWCKCRTAPATPAEQKHAAIKTVGDAKAGQLEAALRIIRDTAAATPVMSSNDTRSAMFHAGIDGPVVGAAFARAVKQGWIEPESFTPSTDPATHGHNVRTYVSRLYGREVA